MNDLSWVRVFLASLNAWSEMDLDPVLFTKFWIIFRLKIEEYNKENKYE